MNDDKIIVIQPADPQVVYVPTYSPTVVYGTWPYPTTVYAPLYAPPPRGYGMLAFATGVAVGAALWGNCHWGWGHSQCNVNINHYNNFNRNTSNRPGKWQGNGPGGNRWKHDPSHRGGVNYRDRQTAGRFGSQGNRNRVTRNEARGFRDSGGRGARPSRDARPVRPAGTTSRSKAPGRTRPATSQKGGAFGGARNPKLDRAASNRGASSRGRSARSGSRAGRGSGSRGGGRGGSRGGSRGGRGGGRR